MRQTARERFDAKTTRRGDCLIWTGSKNRSGYGNFWIGGGTRVVHRLAYEWKHGPLPEATYLYPSCNERLCVEVLHLEPSAVQRCFT